MTYWQVAAGEGPRDYSEVFLKYGVILMGSGHIGSFLEHPERFRGHKDWRRKIVTLADRMKCGDVVILKRGQGAKGRIVAAGRVTSEYEWLEPFDDVEGWDLRHGRRVEWFKPDSSTLVDGLARGTISRVYQGRPRELADSLLFDDCKKREAEEIPPPANRISEEHLVGSLIENGLRPADAEAVIRAIWHVRRLARWYADYGWNISEHEARTFLIAPILLALGWSEQRIKIEWNHTDVSLFNEPFRRGAEQGAPRVILESKRMGTGLDHAERQVRRYARDFPCCNMLVTTTGVRYHLYEKKPCESWDASRMKEKHLSAVLNLFNLKDRHPFLANVGGAPALFKSLMPG